MKMVLTLATVSLLATGCARYPYDDNYARINTGTNGMTCEIEEGAVEMFAGQMASVEVGNAILAETGAGNLRWIRPDMAVTMDYRPDRVQVDLDSDNRITGMKCG